MEQSVLMDGREDCVRVWEGQSSWVGGWMHVPQVMGGSSKIDGARMRGARIVA